jgi:hypothetical protein
VERVILWHILRHGTTRGNRGTLLGDCRLVPQFGRICLLPFQVQFYVAHSVVLLRLLGSSQYLFHDVHSPQGHVVRR